jgi:hypothetical protein
MIFLLVASSLAMQGCDKIALEPIHGRLRSAWTLNDQTSCEVPSGGPVLAKVRIRNVYRWRVRMPGDVAPQVAGAEGIRWKVLRPLPVTLAAGDEIEGSWLMEGTLRPGRYQIDFPSDALISGSAAELEVGSEAVSQALLLEMRATVAKLSGTSLDLAEELLRKPSAELLPTTRLVIADLYRSVGDSQRAEEQMERFAEEIYGTEELPNWVRMNMQPPSQDK